MSINRANVKIWKGSNTQRKSVSELIMGSSQIPKGIYVKSIFQDNVLPFETEYIELMEKTASGLWATLFRVSTSNK